MTAPVLLICCHSDTAYCLVVLLSRKYFCFICFVLCIFVCYFAVRKSIAPPGMRNFVEMKVVNTIKELRELLDGYRAEGKKIGLVPTMGALHRGHASLVERSIAGNDVTVVSIFVNPTQFNDKNDLKNYPRTLEADCALLEKVGATVAFAPAVEEMYPEEDTRQFSFAPLDTVMEGACRPGHFNGVVQVVSRLFDLVQPTRAYFGEKDFQQLAIIHHMVERSSLSERYTGLKIVDCPIVREASGLAMSSRNERLSSEEKQTAVTISQTLFASLQWAKIASVKEVQQRVIDTINAVDGLEVEYYEIVDKNTLQPTDNWDNAVGCVTVYCGPVRLIDNIRYQ